MTILVMDWPAFGCETVKKTLSDIGHKVENFDFPQRSNETSHGEELGVAIAEKILAVNADIVFSFNYFPVIATAVHACRKKYVSWIYDSPAVLLYSMTVFFPENYIFHFDSYEVERMSREGVEHVWYLPLASNVEAYDVMIPTDEERKKYCADIAMIGSMYRGKYQYFDKYTGFEDYLKGYLDAVVHTQERVYGVNFLQEVLMPEIMKRVLKTVPLMEEKGDSYDTAEWDFANYYLAMRVAAEERKHMLNALADHYDVALYTNGETSDSPKVRNMGSVDYYTEAPYAMKCAKINLNISLRSIRTGIPQRVMDIMGCGGFVLSNYQADLCEEFVAGEDFVYYESIEDAVEKAGYYLGHEEERERIAENGYRKVKDYHNFREKCNRILQMVSGDAKE
ncbi:MAG: glycosyltransferase [Lachnospiraceae bacterium]|nr:glycosyltransferase [Lachnospiraceae bacterium]